MKFPKPNIIDQWLDKYGDPEIEKQVDMKAKLLEIKEHEASKKGGTSIDKLMLRAYEAGLKEGYVKGGDDTHTAAKKLRVKDYLNGWNDALELAAEKATLLINGVEASASNIKVDKQSILNLKKD